MDAIRIKLHSAQQAHAAITSAYQAVKPWLMAGHALVLSIKPETRSSAANARLHAMLTDIARQVVWAGKRRPVSVWKRLMTAAWLRAQKENVELLPSVDDHGVDIIYEKTSEMSGAQVSSVMDYIEAWGAEHGVRFTAPEYESEAA